MIYSYNKSQRDALFLKFILTNNSKCFRQSYCLSSGVLTLYSQQLVFVILVMLAVCWQIVNITSMLLQLLKEEVQDCSVYINKFYS